MLEMDRQIVRVIEVETRCYSIQAKREGNVKVVVTKGI